MFRNLIETIQSAFPVSEVERNITAQIDPLIDHLVKYLRYDDPLNSKKYLLTIRNILRTICRLKSRSKSRISEKKLLSWISFERIEYYIDDSINHFDEEYKLIIKRDRESVKKMVKSIIHDFFINIGKSKHEKECFEYYEKVVAHLKTTKGGQKSGFN